MKVSGTKFLQAAKVKRGISQLLLKDKKMNLAGLQLADPVVSPIGRHVLGKPAKDDWQIVESKLRHRPGGGYMGSGLVILPKQ